MKTEAIDRTDLKGNSKLRSGKVRDVYDLGDKLLIVATDRLSAFDVVLPEPIPDKGTVLTQLSAFWFERFQDTVAANHMITLLTRRSGRVETASQDPGKTLDAVTHTRPSRCRLSASCAGAVRLGLEGLRCDRRGLRYPAAGA